MKVGKIKSGNCHEFLERPIMTDLQIIFFLVKLSVFCLKYITLCISTPPALSAGSGPQSAATVS